jgi:hypothetical protein
VHSYDSIGSYRYKSTYTLVNVNLNSRRDDCAYGCFDIIVVDCIEDTYRNNNVEVNHAMQEHQQQFLGPSTADSYLTIDFVNK